MEVGRKKKGGEGGAGSSIRSERPPPPVEPKTAALVRVAAAIAAGETAELEARLGAARGAGGAPLWVGGVLLQRLLVVGYPPRLVAVGGWRQGSGPPPDHRSGRDAAALGDAGWEAWA